MGVAAATAVGCGAQTDSHDGKIGDLQCDITCVEAFFDGCFEPSGTCLSVNNDGRDTDRVCWADGTYVDYATTGVAIETKLRLWGANGLCATEDRSGTVTRTDLERLTIAVDEATGRYSVTCTDGSIVTRSEVEVMSGCPMLQGMRPGFEQPYFSGDYVGCAAGDCPR